MITYTPESLTFIGGRYEFSSKQREAFLSHWSSPERNMPYLLFDRIGDGIRIKAQSELESVNQSDDLMRLHLFGEGGDLLWRRDEDRVFWRFVGVKTPQLAGFSFKDFWASNQVETLTWDETPLESLLWGKRNISDEVWHEDRVGKASEEGRLDYPVEKQAGRVLIQAAALRIGSGLDGNPHPEAGSVAAVWTYALVNVSASGE